MTLLRMEKGTIDNGNGPFKVSMHLITHSSNLGFNGHDGY
jgi:hypothetical protein